MNKQRKPNLSALSDFSTLDYERMMRIESPVFLTHDRSGSQQLLRDLARSPTSEMLGERS
jgi:hypothetical protein